MIDGNAKGSTTLSRLELLGAAALFSTGGAAIKATSLTSWQVASMRSGIAAAAILLLVPAARRNWSWRVLAVGAPYAATLMFFVLATKLTTAANAVFLQSTAPLYLLFLGPLVLREPVRRSDLFFLGVIAMGLVFCFLGSQAPSVTAPDPFRGNILGALSGVAWALTVTGLRYAESPEGRSGSGIATVVAGNLIACLVCLPMALPLTAAHPTDWLVVAYLGVVQIGVAYTLLTKAIRNLPALETTLILLAEPALNPVWAALVHGERPGGWAIAGGVLILAATLGRLLTAGK